VERWLASIGKAAKQVEACQATETAAWTTSAPYSIRPDFSTSRLEHKSFFLLTVFVTVSQPS
jgi:hypothetical protein